MREVLSDIDKWLNNTDRIALATVIRTWGSAPRGVGAKMALTPDGKISGSVSGGCVEGAVVQAGAQVLKSGRAQLLHFGVTDETAWEVGLACGGSLDVFVQPLDRSIYAAIHQSIQNDQASAKIMIVRGSTDWLGRELFLHADGSTVGELPIEIKQVALDAAESALTAGQSQSIALNEVELFIDLMLPAPTLIMVGGVHIAIALTSLAKTLGYQTVVIDPRRAFGSEERFPAADQLIRAWPVEAFKSIVINSTTALAMLTHDPKIDDPALMIALTSPAFYVGALGSQKTQRARRERLIQAGLPEAQLDRLRGPIGLQINARLPEEIALAIMAEIVAARNGASHNL